MEEKVRKVYLGGRERKRITDSRMRRMAQWLWHQTTCTLVVQIYSTNKILSIYVQGAKGTVV
jgi:hypothetical protein